MDVWIKVSHVLLQRCFFNFNLIDWLIDWIVAFLPLKVFIFIAKKSLMRPNFSIELFIMGFMDSGIFALILLNSQLQLSYNLRMFVYPSSVCVDLSFGQPTDFRNYEIWLKFCTLVPWPNTLDLFFFHFIKIYFFLFIYFF